ncbi:MAG: flagellar biosynthetic protein FliR [Clostridiales bacterium]|jgi:flagellar biosynthetic protein FliR|nr:flagellar biosynthetic protein FliR [Clostridiales bacterium]
MIDFAPMALDSLSEDIDVFLIIFARVSGFIVTLPPLSGASIPNMSKIMISIAVSVLLFESGVAGTISYEEKMYAILIVREAVLGLATGFVVYMAFSVFALAGQLIDFQIGLSLASLLDPLTQIQMPITGNLLYLIMCVALIRTGGLHALIAAMASSFSKIPAGEGVAALGEEAVLGAIGLLGEVIASGLRIAMPIVAAMLIIDVVLGILVRTVPQMNVFVVGMPLKIIAGIIVLYLITPSLALAFKHVYNTMMGAVKVMALSP